MEECLNCGENYIRNKHNQKWCSKKCASAAWKLRHPEHKETKRKWDIDNIEWKRQYERERLKIDTPLRDYRKKSHRQYSLRTYFDISEDQYNELLEKQQHSCAICKRHHTEFNKYLAVDHSHQTGEIRGLLCTECNKNLIRNHEDPSIFRTAAEYLETSKTGWKKKKKYKKGKFIKT